jgi:hypothetical protein
VCDHVLCIDASNMAIRVNLTKERRVITFESRKLNNGELNYPIYGKELLH